ncbi:MAG: CHAD domain-containing protein [Planctomycetota bacterium]|nr:MAG: CHAD domain-containing protein [Planctomycetota bacterium]
MMSDATGALMDLKPYKPMLGRTIDGLESSTPLTDAARLAVGGRLSAVNGLIPHVLEHGADEARPVHRLRVATRRASAAVALVADRLPGKRVKAVTRALRRLRRSAARVRAADVHAEMLLGRVAAADPRAPALALAAGLTLAERAEAFDRLRRSIEDGAGDDLAGAGRRLLDLMRDRPSLGGEFGPAARAAVTDQMGRARAAAREDLREPDRLHGLRIELKRLRYTIEAVGAVADEIGARPLYALLIDAQDRFGAVNDAVELAHRLAGAHERLASGPAPAPPSVLESLADAARDEEAQARALHESLTRWWPASALAGALRDAGCAPPGARR